MTLIDTCFAAIISIGLLQNSGTASHDLASGTGTLDDGVLLRSRIIEESSGGRKQAKLLGLGMRVLHNEMERYLYDKSSQSYFGYEMRVATQPGSDALELTFGPLALEKVHGTLKEMASGLPLNPGPQPRFPAAQVVHFGDTIAIGLLVSPDGKNRIVDSIKFEHASEEQLTLKANALKPIEFTPDDGPVRLSHLEGISIDGQKATDPLVTIPQKRGATIWISLPERGRYVLSLAPHEGFEKAGKVDYDSISFDMDSHHYEMYFEEPVVNSFSPLNLYLKHDSTFVPQRALAHSIVLGCDRLEFLFPKNKPAP